MRSSDTGARPPCHAHWDHSRPFPKKNRVSSEGDTHMTYAPAHRPFYDADSHIMELPDFLKKFADPEWREEIPNVSYSASVVTDEEVAEIVARGSRQR